MATLKDIIRQEFKTKIEGDSFSSIIKEKALNKQVLINSIEALLPDKDWKELENNDPIRLHKKNALKLINNLKD